MAAHYRNGGLPPWAATTPGDPVKAPLLHNDYNANTGVTYPATHNTQNSGPHENPSQFGVYGNLPPSNTQSTAPYSNATGQTGFTAASYHTAGSVPQSPPPQSLSPHLRHSHYSTTTASFEPYNAPLNPSGSPGLYTPAPYAPPAGAPTQYSAPSSPSPAPGTPAPYGAAPAYDAPSPHTEAGGSGPAPSYSGGPYGANQYPKEKGWEYTSPPTEYPPKQ